MIRKVTYTTTDGNKITVEYDDEAPCRICGLPVFEASMGGTDICPWCDMGVARPVQLGPAPERGALGKKEQKKKFE